MDAPRLSQRRVVVYTQQLLLALNAHGEGVAAHVLSQLGVDLEKAAVATTHVRFPTAQTLGALSGPSVYFEQPQ
jgi:hypothetical protein